MTVRIYQPPKNAMQSGRGNAKRWLVEYEPAAARKVEPLMGWTSSPDTRQQLKLWFDTKDEAVAYCERHGLIYQVSETTMGCTINRYRPSTHLKSSPIIDIRCRVSTSVFAVCRSVCAENCLKTCVSRRIQLETGP